MVSQSMGLFVSQSMGLFVSQPMGLSYFLQLSCLVTGEKDGQPINGIIFLQQFRCLVKYFIQKRYIISVI